MGVFIISPTDKGGRLYAPSDKLRELTAPLSPMAFNDLWCLTNLDVHTLSLGAAVPSDFDAHVEALELLDDAPRLLPPSSRGWRRPTRTRWARTSRAAGRRACPSGPSCPARSTCAASCGCTTWCAPTISSTSRRSATSR